MVAEFNEEMMEEIEINTDKLIDAVQAGDGPLVFEDAYGNGIALINDKSFASWHDVAIEFGVDILDFQAEDKDEEVMEELGCTKEDLEAINF